MSSMLAAHQKERRMCYAISRIIALGPGGGGFSLPLGHGIQHNVHHDFALSAEVQVFSYLSMVVGGDICYFVLEGSGVFSQEVIDGDAEEGRELVQFPHGTAGAALIFIVGSACHADALRHFPLGQAFLLTEGAQAAGCDIHGENHSSDIRCMGIVKGWKPNIDIISDGKSRKKGVYLLHLFLTVSLNERIM